MTTLPTLCIYGKSRWCVNWGQFKDPLFCGCVITLLFGRFQVWITLLISTDFLSLNSAKPFGKNSNASFSLHGTGYGTDNNTGEMIETQLPRSLPMYKWFCEHFCTQYHRTYWSQSPFQSLSLARSRAAWMNNNKHILLREGDILSGNNLDLEIAIHNTKKAAGIPTQREYVSQKVKFLANWLTTLIGSKNMTNYCWLFPKLVFVMTVLYN